MIVLNHVTEVGWNYGMHDALQRRNSAQYQHEFINDHDAAMAFVSKLITNGANDVFVRHQLVPAEGES